MTKKKIKTKEEIERINECLKNKDERIKELEKTEHSRVFWYKAILYIIESFIILYVLNFAVYQVNNLLPIMIEFNAKRIVVTSYYYPITFLSFWGITFLVNGMVFWYWIIKGLFIPLYRWNDKYHYPYRYEND